MTIDDALERLAAGDYPAAREILRDTHTPQARQLKELCNILEYLDHEQFIELSEMLIAIKTGYVPTEPFGELLSRLKSLVYRGRYGEAHTVLLEYARIPDSPHQVELHKRLWQYQHSDAAKAGKYLPGRPGCVTLYIVLSVFSAVFTAFLTIFLTTEELGGRFNEIFLLCISPGYSVAVAVGLWNMKNWGRQLLIVGTSFSIALTILMIPVASPTLSSLASMVVGIIVIRWFWKNRDYFD